MEGNRNLDEELNATMLTDTQLQLLDSLPIYDGAGQVSIAHMVGFYTKTVHAKFTAVNFTRLDSSGFATSFLSLCYFPEKKEYKLINGDITQLDQFLAVAAVVS